VNTLNFTFLRHNNIDLYLTTLILLGSALGTLLYQDSLLNAPGTDKLHHVVAFMALSFPVALIRPKYIRAILALSLLYGVSIEIIRPLVNRSGELLDFWSDAIGVALGAGLAKALHYKGYGLE
jgi:hypothetical protein